MKANQKIKAAMRRNEQQVVAFVKREGFITYGPLLGIVWMKAVDRLEAKGKLRYSHKRSGYVLAN